MMTEENVQIQRLIKQQQSSRALRPFSYQVKSSLRMAALNQEPLCANITEEIYTTLMERIIDYAMGIHQISR